MPRGFSIAIDGPVASGKGTTAKALAQKLDGIFIDTGAMYRTVGLICLEQKINPNDRETVEKTTSDLNIEFDGEKVLLNSRDVSSKIRESEVSNITSIIATYPKVRKDMVFKQKEIADKSLANNRVIIMEGRDIGTKVLPQADLKVFLNASLEVRARRRFEQHIEQGLQVKYEDILNETRTRDERDMNRKTDPLPSNPQDLGYFVIDSSTQTEEETISLIMAELKKKGLLND